MPKYVATMLSQYVDKTSRIKYKKPAKSGMLNRRKLSGGNKSLHKIYVLQTLCTKQECSVNFHTGNQILKKHGKGRFTWYDFDACDKLATCLQCDHKCERALDDVFGIRVTVRPCCEKRTETTLQNSLKFSDCCKSIQKQIWPSCRKTFRPHFLFVWFHESNEI